MSKQLEKKAKQIEARQFANHEKRRAEKATKRKERERKKATLANYRAKQADIQESTDPGQKKKYISQKIKFFFKL
ncbi:MAG: hypothetical protein PWQ63_1680 [Methanolobus sp.]|jgi:hypothetical protein|nr:hypothetical protein [Methanolobus sp.]